MRIFLTGATGYIGRALAARLAAEGHELRALVRPTSDLARLAGVEIATFTGDVADRYSMREGMSGSDAVVHLAAELDFGAPPARMEAINVGGAENVASLAYKLGVGRLLAVSSVAALGGSPDDGSPADLATPRPEAPMRYGRTKAAGDRAIAEWAKRGLAVDTVHPSLVYGPPGKKEGANAFLRRIALGRMPAIVAPGNRTSWIHLDDVIEAMVRILARPPGGRGGEDPGARPAGRAALGKGWILAGDVVTVRELVERVSAAAGRRPPRLALPLAAARPLAAAAGLAARLRGRRPPFDREQLASLERHWAYDDSATRADLGWSPLGLDEGLPGTVEYLLSRAV
jgi:dihydroflavonol-4-reductase